MKNSLRKACILVALEMLDSEPEKKKPKKLRSSMPAEEAIDMILESASEMTFDSSLVGAAERIYNIASSYTDANVRLAGIRAIRKISEDCTFDSSIKACIGYAEGLAK